MFNKTETKTLGKIKLNITNHKNKKTYGLDFIVVSGPVQALLGLQAIQAMNLITINQEFILSVDPKESVDLISEFSDIFKGEGCLSGKLHLELEENVVPVKQPVRIPLAVKPRLKAEIERLKKLGVIKFVNKPTDWISSMVVVMKRNKKVRLCIDPKPLNKSLKRNNYPIPTIDDVLPDLTNAMIFSLVDGNNGFWHVQLDDESSYLTTFGTQWG